MFQQGSVFLNWGLTVPGGLSGCQQQLARVGDAGWTGPRLSLHKEQLLWPMGKES